MRSLRTLDRDRLAVAAALLGPLAVAAFLGLFRDSFANTNAALVMVLVVVAVGANGDRIAGVVAALSAGVWFDFFLTKPYARFTIRDRADVETTLLLLAVGVAVTELALWGRRKTELASRDAGYLAGITSAAEVMSAGGSTAALIDHVSSELKRILGLDTIRFEYGVAGLGDPARLRHDGEVEWHGHLVDVERGDLPVDRDLELIVEQGGSLRGRFIMRAAPNMRPSRPQRLVAVTLANQVGGVLG
jgi:K+-sensing histidine kinase KdpD